MQHQRTIDNCHLSASVSQGRRGGAEGARCHGCTFSLWPLCRCRGHGRMGQVNRPTQSDLRCEWLRLLLGRRPLPPV